MVCNYLPIQRLESSFFGFFFLPHPPTSSLYMPFATNHESFLLHGVSLLRQERLLGTLVEQLGRLLEDTSMITVVLLEC